MWNPEDLRAPLILGWYLVFWGYLFVRYQGFDGCTRQMLENSRNYRWIPTWPADQPVAKLYRLVRVVLTLLLVVHTLLIAAILWDFLT